MTINPTTLAINNLYDDKGNLIPATLSTDGHFFIIPTTTGFLYLATGPLEVRDGRGAQRFRARFFCCTEVFLYTAGPTGYNFDIGVQLCYNKVSIGNFCRGSGFPQVLYNKEVHPWGFPASAFLSFCRWWRRSICICRIKSQPGFLLAASWVFYLLAMPAMFVVLLGITAASYCIARGLESAHRAAWLHGGVVCLLAVLAFFKYGPALNAAWDLGLPDIAFPLGISFYTFAVISYLVDASRGDCPGGEKLHHPRAVSLLFPHRHLGAHLPRRGTDAPAGRRAPF